MRLVAVVLLAVLAAVRPVAAQRIFGFGDDASTLRAGALRVTAGSLWDRANERYDADGKLRPLGAAASTPSWNGLYDARLAAAGPLVSTLAGLAGFDATLGALAIARRDASVDSPLGLEVGVLSRLTVGVRIRVASHAIEPDLVVNPDRIEGTMGLNPAWSSTAAHDRNVQIVTQFDSAATQLTRRIAQCQATPTTPGCAPVLANVAGAQALVASAASFATALNALYGGRKGAVGLPFVPVSNGTAQQAINQRVLGFRDRFVALGNLAIGSQGPAGGALVSPADVGLLLSDSLYGYLLRPLRAVHAYGPGEVAVHMKLRLLQTTGDDTGTVRGFAVRQSVGAALRLSGGSAPSADEPFAPTTGDGSSGFGVQSFTDVWFLKRFAASIVVGLDQGGAQEFAMRVPAADAPAVGGVPFPLLLTSRETQLTRTPGSRIDVAITPRVAVTRNIWLGGSWVMSRQAADEWSVAPHPPVVPSATEPYVSDADANAWAAGTDWTEHRLSLGGTYSTVEAARAGKTRHAFDVTYEHQQTTAGRGWRVSKVTRDVVTVRWYRRLWGRP